MLKTVANAPNVSEAGRKMFSSAFSFLLSGSVLPSSPPNTSVTVWPANSMMPPTEVSLR